MKFCVDCNKPYERALRHDSRCLGYSNCFPILKGFLSKMSLLSSDSSRTLSKRGRAQAVTKNRMFLFLGRAER